MQTSSSAPKVQSCSTAPSHNQRYPGSMSTSTYTRPGDRSETKCGQCAPRLLDHPNLPFGSIVSTFETCFGPTKQLYPGTRDRAYSSACAILQIYTSARAQSHKRTLKYPIPAVFPNSLPHIDPDLYHVICMLKSDSSKPTLDFLKGRATAHSHLLWMSKLFLDVTRAGRNPTLVSYRSYLGAAITNSRAIIANILLVWYMILGGNIEEKTFWAIDKSYAVTLLSFSFFQPTQGYLHQ